MSGAATETIAAIFRIERPRLIAGLTRMVRDVGLAEELTQDAFVTAMTEWPRHGVPEKPGAWLMTAAKRRAIDRLRHRTMVERSQVEIARDLDERDTSVEQIEAAMDGQKAKMLEEINKSSSGTIKWESADKFTSGKEGQVATFERMK